ncbi:MAG: endonuclease/exonuclease/phosphatase family protein [Oligoflexales bacterium]|nr:endonuclease/exonuclease/phosphatase family protein [Oligoflexales bacterium]
MNSISGKLSILKMSLNILSAALGSVFLAFVVLRFLAEILIMLNIFTIDVLTYIPPLVVIMLAVIGSVFLFLSGMRKAAFMQLAVSFLIFLFFGDHSLGTALFGTRDAHAHTPDEIRVLALNAQCYTKGADKVFAFINEVKADIVLLSEHDPEDLKDPDALLIGGYKFYGSREDMAIITNRPVISFHEVDLPSYKVSLTKFNDLDTMDRNFHRAFAHAVVDLGGQPTHVISIRFIAGRGKSNNPLDNLSWGKYLLGEQKKEVSFFKEYVKKLSGPIIFGGDLNAPYGSTPIRELKEIGKDARLETNLFGGLTFRNENIPTMRLDYIYTGSPLVKPVSVEILKTFISDHYPVLGTFVVSKAM